MSTWIWPIVTPETVLALGLSRASTTRIGCSGFRADPWGRLLWGHHQISLNTASCFRCSLRWAECCQRRCVQSSRNHPIVPESLISVSWQQVITLSSNIIYDNDCNAKQAEAGRPDEPLNTTYRRPHWSLSTFTNPQAITLLQKQKKGQKETLMNQQSVNRSWQQPEDLWSLKLQDDTADLTRTSAADEEKCYYTCRLHLLQPLTTVPTARR